MPSCLLVSITADQERRFYDRDYARHLTLPDHALRLDRRTLLADLSDPRKAIYERRLLFRMTFDYLDPADLKDVAVLDYGCGAGDWGVWMATEGARVTFLDLSPVAVELALRRAGASGVAGRVGGEARDASDLSGVADGAFDLIFASAAVHHTLKYENALEELVRVLKPGGRLVLAETLGDNRLLNLARRIRARWARQSEDAGEEIIVGRREIGLLRARFRIVDVRPVNLLAMGKRLLRGRFAHPASRLAMSVLESADRNLLRVWPSLARYCGEALIIALK